MGKVANFFSSQGIALALEQKRQMLSLDQEFSALEAKVKILEAEKLHLEGEVNPLKREVERLKNKIQKDSAHDAGQLDEIEIKILQILSSASGRVIAGSIATRLSISQTKADYYLAKLERAGFIHGAHFYTDQSTEYALAHLGREYLVKHDLV